MKKLNLEGQKFGKLTVTSYNGSDGRNSLWNCICECGENTVRNNNTLKKGKCMCKYCSSKILGNLNKSHGMFGTSFYFVWNSLKHRCTNKNNKSYKNYGGRGIHMCDKRKKFEGFSDDMYNSYLEHKKNNIYTSIDRIDVNGNYCKENCRRATSKEQANNTRVNKYYLHNGENKTLAEISYATGVNYKTLHNKVHTLGFSICEALSLLPHTR